ncbi:NmrA family NAD(P)-binding protein [Variovorax sp. ZS18.2.2]|uniref:NmrA family NAD(P)-binding protein n=1 Tax=Variovorax sp. ZS18.2.2 TaxID=2971255 RepID=UPI00215153E6|nr:NmrA family NAD(P)-binding protein [Variovorax sp. ZS18.2.2]MCR6475885.1 NmrA family NAD(P)-binding protein [Variovorax sp. ZS18.2.2]
MYAITGITGNVGGAVARTLLAQGQSVRAVVRDASKGKAWSDLGCEVALADMNDAEALARAFAGVRGVFILPPPNFDPAPGFPEARAVIAAVRQALTEAQPARVICLSTVGAQAAQPNLLSQRSLMEEALVALPLPITFLRPAWFLENLAWDIAPAREKGVLSSFLQPLDRAVPMVATADVGRVAAELLVQDGAVERIVELEGPERVSQHAIAAALAQVLGRPVQAEAVPRETWGSLFLAQGMKDPMPRIQMLDGFNEGWITFEGGDADVRKGKVGLVEVIRSLVD